MAEINSANAEDFNDIIDKIRQTTGVNNTESLVVLGPAGSQEHIKPPGGSELVQARIENKFFFEHTLQREWVFFELVRPPREKKLPVVLSMDEVRRVLGCVHRQRYRVCLSTIYTCGLRLQEGLHLQVKDIDSGRDLVHVCHGKGGKDRYVPLPQQTLQLLRLMAFLSSTILSRTVTSSSNVRDPDLPDGLFTKFRYSWRSRASSLVMDAQLLANTMDGATHSNATITMMRMKRRPPVHYDQCGPHTERAQQVPRLALDTASRSYNSPTNRKC